MSLTLQTAATILYEHHLLREIITRDSWTLNPASIANCDEEFSDVTYNSLQITQGSLLFCKGRFKPEYLAHADELGLAAYVATEDFSQYTAAPGLIVTNASQAMSLLSAAYYEYPQDELTVIGITGTKGKTTTAYLAHAMLNAASGNKAALFSSVDNCLDGVTYDESDLTTPESLDAFRMMREAADNGMQYLIMEVSSQAYKVNRVYGLQFDAAGFLNISPDHISPIEHPTFEDYFYCKRQIVQHTNTLVLGKDCAHADLIEQDAQLNHVPVTTFAVDGDGADITAVCANDTHTEFTLMQHGVTLGTCSLALDGDFNYANAAAAVALTQAVGVPVTQPILDAMSTVRIAGRMEEFRSGDMLAIVDYAHNFASTSALIDFIDQRYGERHPNITLVTGSAGNKAVDRRKEIVEAAQNRVDHLILTYEDTDTESVEDICRAMLGFVTNPQLDARIILDRTQAIETAVREARERDGMQVILVIGKGNERWIKAHNKHVPYEGDDRIIERLFA